MSLLLDKTGQVGGINIPVAKRFVMERNQGWLPLGLLFPLPWLSTMVSPTPHHAIPRKTTPSKVKYKL